jgi:hypothetical protein
MKSYNIKFDINQEVYILTNKAICKSKIEKIRIIECEPYKKYDEVKKCVVDMSGIEIDYLVITKEFNNFHDSEWYPQDEIFETKEDLFNAIK